MSPSLLSNATKDMESDDDEDSRSFSSHREESKDFSTNHSFSSKTGTGKEISNSGDSSMGIGKEENAQVFKLRLLVLAAIFLAAVAVSLAIYFLTRNSEEEELESQFYGASSKVLSSFEDIIKSKLVAIGSLAVQSSLYVNSQPNMSWPLVTIEDWQLRASVARELSGALFARIVPVVKKETRVAWEQYSVANADWLVTAAAYNEANGIGFDRSLQEEQVGEETEAEESYSVGTEDRGIDFSSGIGDKIYGFDETFTPVAMQGDGPFFPLWQESPTFNRDLTNYDTRAYPDYAPFMLKAYETGEMSIGGLDTAPQGNTTHPDLSTSYFALMESVSAGKEVTYQGDPMSSIFLPVFDDFQAKEREVVAVVFAVFKWAFYFEGLLPPNFPGLIVVLRNNCDGAFTYKIKGAEVEYLGPGDLHAGRAKRTDLVQTVDFESASTIGKSNPLQVKLNQDICSYDLSVYPSKELEDEYVTSLPILVTCAVALVFAVTAVVFLIFNRYVERRQALVMDQAVKSTAIVTSLFPEAVRDRLMDSEYSSGKTRLKSFLNDSEKDSGSQPIADLFPHCTVFFGDIAGFTAWSSTRDPASVFILLETLYNGFDIIAKRRGVFKVETIGDSYVAVTGLPNPNPKHAAVMARFAGSCIEKFGEITKKLEHRLGPDTADLGLRVGLHSGPVTAGVLRGERARFQLFGDTVNTAARMESSGKPNKIQVSEATANLLIAEDKEHWIQKRADILNVKGKGIMGSFWVNTRSKGTASSTGSTSGTSENLDVSSFATKVLNHKQDRLVDWVCDLLFRRVQNIMARQDPNKVGRCKRSDLIYTVPPGKTSLDEVAEVIKMPKFDATASQRAKTRGAVEIEPEVKRQLQEIVCALAAMYQENSFHNFEHALHVTMAVDKFMSRIVAPDVDNEGLQVDNHAGIAAEVHQFTHGINSDPITLLAIVFSALIHDADHRGCSNMQLAKEDEQMAELYSNKSIAEQNSLDIAWDLLMQDKYFKLRSALFVNRSEMLRFRQVVVNVVLATDIFDKELNDLRKSRWNKAFSGEQQDAQHNDLRATIVIEHIIQASDVAHTMQHWHIYRKWNERLFFEMYTAYREGRMGTKSPADFWYQGEIGFFDNYIIPLAKKLKECNVFGVSSDECLNYAMRNRMEWEEVGQQITAEMAQRASLMLPSSTSVPPVTKVLESFEDEVIENEVEV